jgi:hypothetical protein
MKTIISFFSIMCIIYQMQTMIYAQDINNLLVEEYTTFSNKNFKDNKKFNFHFESAQKDSFWLFRMNKDFLKSNIFLMKFPNGSMLNYKISKIENISDSRVYYYGRPHNGKLGFCQFMTTNDNNIGMVSYGLRTYKIRNIQDNLYILYVNKRIHRDSVGTFDDIIQVEKINQFQKETSQIDFKDKKGGSKDLVKVKVLLAYNPLCLIEIPDFINEFINSAIIKTNSAFQNSEVSIFLEIAAIVQVDYGNYGGHQVINEFRTDPRINNLRTKYCADQCVLFHLNPLQINSGSGVTYIESPRNYDDAYSGIGGKWQLSDITITHEIAHVYGCHHEIDIEPDGYYPYGHGYYSHQINCNWKTIMSYLCWYDNNTFCDCGPWNPCCPEILYFSNPNLSYGGEFLGRVDSCDNARVLNEQKSSVSSYEVPQDNLFLGYNESIGENEFGFPVVNNSITLTNGFTVEAGGEFEVKFEE